MMTSFEKRCESILERANEFLEGGCEWHEFSNYVFGHSTGVVAMLFPDSDERRLLYDSPEYKQVNEILLNMMREKGIL